MNGFHQRQRALAALAVVLVASALPLTACGTSKVRSKSGLNTVASGAPSPAGAATTPATAPAPTATPTDPMDTTPSSAPSSPSGGGSTGGVKVPLPIITKIKLPPLLPVADCISYDPSTLTLNNAGADGYQVTDGSSSLLILDNLTDATYAWMMLRNYSKQCFIGRDNTYTGDQHHRYLVTYYKGSGPSSVLPTPDCIGYNKATLQVTNLGATGYRVDDGSNPLVLLQTAADANAAKAIAADHNQICFIGRDNHRTNRYEYIAEYWN